MKQVGEILKMKQGELFTKYSTEVEAIRNPEEGRRLMELYAPNKQARYCVFRERCVTGNAPRLKEVAAQYGKELTMTWLVAQLCDFATYCGCRDKLTAEQYKDVAAILMNEFAALKLTEFMLFFYQCKAGEWGRFYGVIDPMQIMQSLRKFTTKSRGEIIEDFIRRKKNEALKNRNNDAVTYEEYIRMKEEAKHNK